MKVEDGIKLQAQLDGELTASEAREIAALIENDAEARALFAELQQTRSILLQ
jgi:anti-sigma factor RsiW